MKKFLGKIFGGKEAEAAKKIQRSPRVRIPLLDSSAFVASNGKSYVLRNLSETGLALLSPGERFPDEASGEIHVGGQRVYVELLAVRRNGDEVGMTIADGATELRALLRRVFTDEFHALQMTEVDGRLQKAVPVGEPKWFYAPGNYELFFVEHEGKLLRFEVEWNGNVLSYEQGSLRFGTVEREAREDVSHAKSALVKWQGDVLTEHKVKALRIIENVPGLDVGPRKLMQDILKN